MKILVINGDSLALNTSANLCHVAYLRGLIAAGHEVTLLSAYKEGYAQDEGMLIPDEVSCYQYNGISLYEKLSLRKHASAGAAEAPSAAGTAPKKPSLKQRLFRAVKQLVYSLYGVHGIYAKFVRTGMRFRSDEEYDCVLSISTPVTSHLLAHKLIRAGHVKCTHWIQIWEDPWYSDAYGFNGKKRVYREEKRLLSFAERVCYVSPLTLKNQQRIYPESASKMYWQPLPYYYKNDTPAAAQTAGNRYGYFGDYSPAARNLAPFYNAAAELGITVNICGNPSKLFPVTETVIIHPRLPLSELKPIEDGTNVLVFLCNRKGGQIPGKIYQYSATNKTILFILDGTEEEKQVLRDYFGAYRRYVFCENNEQSIREAIQRIESGELGEVRSEPVEDFNPVITIEKILAGKKE